MIIFKMLYVKSNYTWRYSLISTYESTSWRKSNEMINHEMMILLNSVSICHNVNASGKRNDYYHEGFWMTMQKYPNKVFPVSRTLYDNFLITVETFLFHDILWSSEFFHISRWDSMSRCYPLSSTNWNSFRSRRRSMIMIWYSCDLEMIMSANGSSICTLIMMKKRDQFFLCDLICSYWTTKDHYQKRKVLFIISQDLKNHHDQGNQRNFGSTKDDGNICRY